MRWKSNWIFLIGILCVIGYGGTALATDPVGVTLILSAKATFDEIHVVNAGEAKVKIKTKGDVDVYTVANRLVPGGDTGWNRHPGPSLVTVKAGALTFYSGDDPTCTPHVVQAGTGFVEPSDDVHIARNEGSVVVEVVAVAIVPEGAARRIDEPRPGNCPF